MQDGPPLGALVVDKDVGNREVGARLVGRPAELARNHHALDGHVEYLSEQGTWISVHVKSRVKVSLLRSTAQWCWMITWKFSARELLVTKPAPSGSKL